jgi:hypothetical protein
MRALQRQAQAREDEAARQEAIRIENERVAEELRIAREQLEAQAEAVRKAAAELAAAQAAEAAARAREEQERADKLAAEEAAARHIAEVEEGARAMLAAMPLPEVTFIDVGEHAQALTDADVKALGIPDSVEGPEVEMPEIASIRLGSLNAEFGFDLREAFVRDSLGVRGARQGSGWIYTDDQRADIIAALIKRLGGLL